MLYTRLKFLAIALALTGCSTAAEPGAAQDASPDSEAESISCSTPVSSLPSPINARALAFCQADALGKIAGYVQEDAVDGKLVSRSRVNINPLAVEIEAFDQTDTPDTAGEEDADTDAQPAAAGTNKAGSATASSSQKAILVQGNTYVQRDGKWVQATTDSDDENLAYQATMPLRFEALLNPHLRAAGTDPELYYEVTGTDTVDGTPVTVLSAQLVRAGSEDSQGADESRLYIRDDYLVLKSESTYDVSGHKQVSTSTLMQVDQPQDIANPRFEDAG